MSYFFAPRIFFKGKFNADVATGNNAGTLSIYDDAGNKVSLDSDVAVFDGDAALIYKNLPQIGAVIFYYFCHI